MGRARLAELAMGLPPRVRADMDHLSETVFTGVLARILLNLLLLAADALPSGGVVALSGDPVAGIVVSAVGNAVAWSTALAAGLLDPASLPTAEPRTVQMALTTRLAQAAGLRLSFLVAVMPGPRNAPRLLLAPA